MFEWMERQLVEVGLGHATALVISRSMGVLLMVVLSFFANLLAKKVIVATLKRIIERTETARDDVLVRRKVFTRLSHIAPALVIYFMVPWVFQGLEHLIVALRRATLVYMVAAIIWVIVSFLDAVVDIYRTYAISRRIPIKSFVQAAKVVVILVGGIIALSAVTDKTPLVFLTGLGAIAAVLLLVFKDTILGFVAGIQLTANDMVRRGDWISMPKFGADGDVEEVYLTTVKVRNFDNTITTIPTYALISGSFKNWRGMSESGGRRIKRSIHLDMNTVRFCDEAMLERFSEIQILQDYLQRKKKEIAVHNAELDGDDDSLVNGRRLTNLGTFRAYVEAYLRNYPMVNPDLTLLVRQLAPTEHGLPLEIYVFTWDKRWIPYEGIQSDIFDHILAVVPQFDLRVFQAPAGADFRELAERTA